MATKAKKRKQRFVFDETAVKNDWEKIVDAIRENPLLYGAAAAFVLLCLVAGAAYRFNAESKSRAAGMGYARALDTHEPGLLVAALEQVAGTKDPIAARALYMMGESAYQAQEYEKTREAFERLRQEVPDSAFTPDAVEGLGYLAENDGQYEAALGFYREIVEKWPTSFARRRQDFNIARCHEELGNLEEAVTAYQAQADQFPASSVAKESNAALERLRGTNPELFPEEEEAPAEEAAPEEVPAEEAAPEQAPVEKAAPEQAPVEKAAPEQAPAETPAPEEVPATDTTPEPSMNTEP